MADAASLDRRIEEKSYDERVIFVNRVARVVKGGRRFRFQALVVVGDHNGRVGVGISKGADVSIAVSKASETAKKGLTKINLYKSTLPHETEGKVGGSQILLMPAAPGSGLIAGGVVRSILEVAGVQNVLSKAHGSNNKANMTYATIDALSKLVPASQWIPNRSKAGIKKTKAKPAAAGGKQ